MNGISSDKEMQKYWCHNGLRWYHLPRFHAGFIEEAKILPDTFTVLAANEWIEEVAQIFSSHFVYIGIEILF